MGEGGGPAPRAPPLQNGFPVSTALGVSDFKGASWHLTKQSLDPPRNGKDEICCRASPRKSDLPCSDLRVKTLALEAGKMAQWVEAVSGVKGLTECRGVCAECVKS